MMKRNHFLRNITLILVGGVILMLGVFLWLISPMPQPQDDVLSNQNYYIAHATGAINGKTYLNCQEALLQSLNNGYKYVELDLSLTTDSALVCVHDWAYFCKNLVGDSIETAISTKEFLGKSILGQYTPLTLQQAIEIQRIHPYIIVTDKISDTKILNREFLQNRHKVMVEAFTLSDYVELKKAGYIPMMSLWTFDYSQIFWDFIYYPLKYHTKIDWICVHSSSNIKSLRMLKRLFNCKVAMYTCNSRAFFTEHLGKEIDLIYTDNWNPLKQTNNDTLYTTVY
ncbi:MAG: hypothetical protein IJP82_08685 [Bacteroidaceae bacterium]|nr:hypothetical protein [Bacteroidaceae bacterium]